MMNDKRRVLERTKLFALWVVRLYSALLRLADLMKQANEMTALLDTTGEISNGLYFGLPPHN